MKRIQSAFVTGLLVLVPVFATIQILMWLISSLDNSARKFLPILPETMGLGVILTFFCVVIAGFLTQNFLGRWFFTQTDLWIRKVTFVGGIYSAIKKFLEALLNPQNNKFKGCVLVEFPKSGIYSIGFRTGMPDPKLKESAKKDLVNVFVPCTPNPTSGFYILVSEEALIPLNLTVQEAFRLVISMGMVTSESSQ